MSDAVPVTNLGDVLRLLAMSSNRAIRAVRSGDAGLLKLPLDEPAAVVAIDDDVITGSVGPDAFSVTVTAWMRRRASVIVVASENPPVEAVLALARMLREGHSIALVLTTVERYGAWAKALPDCNVRVVVDDAPGHTVH